MTMERNDAGSPNGSEEKLTAPGRSGDSATDQSSSTDDAASAPFSSSHAAEHDRSDARGKETSRLLNAVTFGAAGAAGGGVAGTLVGWGGTKTTLPRRTRITRVDPTTLPRTEIHRTQRSSATSPPPTHSATTQTGCSRTNLFGTSRDAALA